MSGVHETLALLGLAVLLVVVVGRPRGLPEMIAAVPVVGLLLAVNAISARAAWSEIRQIGPVVGFLAAVLVIADCCAADGVFEAAGALMARGAGRSSSRLLAVVVVVASVTTALLSLDTTVVLLTPVVVATVRAVDAQPRPPLYATAHLANSASLLLPVSNLTNLLAVAIVPVSFVRFGALFALPWFVAIAVEWIAVRLVFRGDFGDRIAVVANTAASPFPRYATAVTVVTVIGFGIGSSLGLAPVWVATAGAVLLAARRLLARRTSVAGIVGSAAPSFCLFVLGLAVVVRAASADGLATAVRHVVPSGSGFVALLGVAAVAALVANLVNNLPAALLLLPIAAASGTGSALAVLIGVNIGPNLTYAGSLATLLWRRSVAAVDGVPTVRDFTNLGAVATPAAIIGATAALWLSLKVVGV